MRIFCLLALLLLCNAINSQDYYGDRLFLKIKYAFKDEYYLLKDTRLTSILSSKYIKSFQPVSQHPLLNHTYELILNEDYGIDSLLLKLSQIEQIDYAEKVPLYKVFFTPNDPMYSTQWNLSKIQADLAWNLGQGCTNVKIAVTDDGFLLNHEDLVNQWYINSGEINGNGIDDDGNGYVDDWRGWDAANNDNDPSATASTNSFFTHGTHVAGIVAAQTHNNLGIASIGYNCKMIPVKIGSSPSSSLTGAFQGLDYAINASGCDVINMSWGGGGWSATYQALFNIAKTKGILCVAAAGNSNTSTPMYPASYNHVISVAASSSNDARASFSNYGSSIDVTAPGVNIQSCLAGATNAYGNMSGTSMASPLVAGLCGLMKCYNPMLADSIEICLKRTCDNINAQNPSFIGQLGAGRINAFQALQCLTKKPKSDFLALDTFQCIGKSVRYIVKSLGIPTLTYNWSFPGGTPSTSTSANPVVTYSANGLKSATLITCNSIGCDTITKTNYVHIDTPKAWLINRSYTSYNSSSAIITVHFKGNSPYNVTLTDGINNFTQTNIRSNPYFFSIIPLKDTSLIRISSFSDSSCVGNKFGLDTIYRINLSGGGGVQYCESSFKFNGTNNNVVKITPQNGVAFKDLYSTNGFTWECWFNLGNRSSASVTGIESVMGATDAQLCEDIGFHFNWPWSGSGKFNWVVSGQNGCSVPKGVIGTNMTFNANTWYHAAGVMNYNTNTMQLYINGSLVNSGTITIPMSQRMQNSVAVTIGNQDVNYNPYHTFTPFNGKIDEVRFWNTVRTASEIQANYKACLAANTSNLVAYFKADEGTGTSTTSLVNGNFVGTLQNSASWDTQVDSVKNCTLCNNLASDCDTTNLNTGKVLHLDFNGNTQDKSGLGNHATNFGATPVSGKAGVANTAYRFNGSGDYMKVVNSSTLSLGNTYSFTALIKVDGFNSASCRGNAILFKGHSVNISTNPHFDWVYSPNAYTGSCSAPLDVTHQNLFVGSMTTPSPTVYSPFLSANKWYCLAVVNKNDTAYTYIDGVEVYKQSNQYNGGNNNYDLYIGKTTYPSFPYLLNATIDEIRLYNRALTPSEVKGYCGTCTTVQPPQSDCDTTNLNTGKVLHLDFNGNTQDKSGLGNHAMNFGATPVAGKAGVVNTAYRFNGTSNYMRVSNNATINSMTKVTMCAILKPKGFYNGPCMNNQIMSKNNINNSGHYSLVYAPLNDNGACSALQDSNKCNFYSGISSGGCSVSTIYKAPFIKKDSWYCVVTTYDGDTAKNYVNGELRFTCKINLPLGSNSADLFIGKLDNISYPYWLNADVDDIRIYNRVLVPSEVKGYCGTCASIQPPPCDTAQKFTYTQCLNDSIQVMARSGSKYQWSPNTGLSNDTIRNPKIFVSNNQRYLVSYTSSKNCQLIDTIDIEVKTAAVYPKMVDQLICIGDSVQVTIPIYATNIVWSPNTAISSTSSKNSFFFPTIPTTYYLEFRDTFGCLQRDTFIVDTKVCCPARARFSIPKDLLCFGETLPITNTSKGPITSYNWNFGAAIPNTFASANPPILNFHSGGSYTLRLIVTNGSCFDTMIKTVNVVHIIPNAGRDTTNCLGAFTTQLGESAISDWTYNWTPTKYLNNPKIADPLCSIVNDSVNYVLEIIDRNSGCKAYDTVLVYTNRKIDSTVQNLRICGGDSILFNGVQRKTSGNYYFTIKKADGICDSFISVLRLSVLQNQFVKRTDTSVCEVFYDNKGIKHTVSFTQYDTIRSQSILNCDSLIYSRNIKIYNRFYRQRNVSGCTPFRYNGKTYTESKMKADSIRIRNVNFLGDCDTLEYINVIVYPKPKAEITPSIPNPVMYKQTVTLSASGGSKYLWLQTNSQDRDVEYKVLNTIPKLFTVRVTDNHQCWDTVSYVVNGILPDTCYYGFPNAFTPNGDGLNDEYIPNMDECTEVKVLAIYDRWGEKVFEANQLKGWDGVFKGKPATMGVYIYYAELNTPWGIRKLNGSFTLIR